MKSSSNALSGSMSWLNRINLSRENPLPRVISQKSVVLRPLVKIGEMTSSNDPCSSVTPTSPSSTANTSNVLQYQSPRNTNILGNLSVHSPAAPSPVRSSESNERSSSSCSGSLEHKVHQKFRELKKLSDTSSPCSPNHIKPSTSAHVKLAECRSYSVLRPRKKESTLSAISEKSGREINSNKKKTFRPKSLNKSIENSRAPAVSKPELNLTNAVKIMDLGSVPLKAKPTECVSKPCENKTAEVQATPIIQSKPTLTPIRKRYKLVGRKSESMKTPIRKRTSHLDILSLIAAELRNIDTCPMHKRNRRKKKKNKHFKCNPIAVQATDHEPEKEEPSGTHTGDLPDNAFGNLDPRPIEPDDPNTAKCRGKPPTGISRQDSNSGAKFDNSRPKTYEALGLPPLRRSPSSENHFPVVLQALAILERCKKYNKPETPSPKRGKSPKFTKPGEDRRQESAKLSQTLTRLPSVSKPDTESSESEKSSQGESKPAQSLAVSATTNQNKDLKIQGTPSSPVNELKNQASLLVSRYSSNYRPVLKTGKR